MMRRILLAITFCGLSSAAFAQTYPSPRFGNVNVSSGGSYQINGTSVLGLSGTTPTMPSGLIGPGTLASAYSANGFIASIRASNFTAESVYSAMYPGVTSFDAVQGVASLPAGSTVTQVNGVAGYVRGLTGASAGARNSVALFGAGTAEVNNAAVWGTNTLLQDAATRTVGTGTGRILVGHEGDFNVMNPATEVHGFTVGGNSLATPAIANGYTSNPLGTGIPWVTSFLSMDGAAETGVNMGALATSGTSVNSQKLQFSYFDIGSVKQTMVLQAQGGYLVLDAGGGGKNFVARGSGQFDNGVTIGTGTAYQINGTTVLSMSGSTPQIPGPNLTGTPTSTTAAVDTNTTQVATTAYVVAQAASATPLINGTAAAGTSTRFARADHVHPTDTTRAPLASPSFTGTVTMGAALKLAKTTAATVLAITCDSSSEGQLYGVTDANSAVFNAALASGGANHMMAYCDATSWKVR
jgi:hypothetical protein